MTDDESRKAWSDFAERRMETIEEAGALVQTTYACVRLFDDLLRLYHEHQSEMDPDTAQACLLKLHELRQRAENLETHISMLMTDVVNLRQPERRTRQRRQHAVAVYWDRRSVDRRDDSQSSN